LEAFVDKRLFGKAEKEVSGIGFGAWGIGSKHYGEVDTDQAADAVRAYIEAGGNFIDTARGYNHSERIIGNVMKDMACRDDVFLCSKIWPNDPAEIRSACDECLSELQVEMIDLMYLHDPPDEPEQMNEVLGVYDELREAGKIRHIGASIKGASVKQETADLCRQYIATGKLTAIQLIYSILRQKNNRVFAEAARHGVAIVARTVLESGMLTGKYRRGHKFPEGFPDGDHRSRWNGRQLDEIIENVNAIRGIAVNPPFENVAQIALRFVLDDPGVTVAIPGGKSRKQVTANLDVDNLPMLKDDVRGELVQRFADCEALVNLD
jgi:aryl-alcohol dehydrogenase-like predicted oxidoreductase